MEKTERIRKEYLKIKRVLKGLDKDRQTIADSLMQRAAFMSVTIADLEDDINERGYISEYQNGKDQWGTKKSPEIEIYNTMIKNYAAVIRQLCDDLPKTEAGAVKSDLLKFLGDKRA
jgi:hypothetical protein